MGLKLRRVDPPVAARIVEAPPSETFVIAFPFDDDELYSQKALIDLDKAWHAIHFLLSGTDWDGNLPAGFLLAGQAVSGDEGYGPVQMLSPIEVGAIAVFLSGVSVADMASRFNFEQLQNRDIYPSIWDRKDPAD